MTGRKDRKSSLFSFTSEALGRTAATLGLVFIIVAGLFQGKAAAMQYCIDLGGGSFDCREVSGWYTVVTSVTPIGGQQNTLGVCSYSLDWPNFRPGTTYDTIIDYSCEGETLPERGYFRCVENEPRAVGDVIFNNCLKPENDLGAPDECLKKE